MAFLDFLFGEKEKVEQIPRFSPQQESVLNQLLGGASQQLPQGLQFLNQILSQDPELMNQFEAPTRRAFAEQTVPTIAERFSSMNAQKSSAFGQQLGEAGKRLEEGLASQRAGRGFDALGQLQSLLGSGLTPRSENIFRPGTSGFLGGAASSLAQVLPYLLLA